MKYVKIEGGKVIQVQPNKEAGFIKVSDDIVCGMNQNTDGSFSVDEVVLTPKQIASQAKQTGEIYADTGITVPFTNEVANGLMQVRNGFDAAKELVAAGGMTQADYDALSVNLEISTTVKLPLTPATILPFSAWFWTKRSAFF